jgi:predicted double-glycine peptidase
VTIFRVVFTCALALTLLHPRAVQAEEQKSRLLEIPFVPQSEALCGGAAAAMVFRYWRAAPAYADDFASLVEDSAEGIKLGNLARAIRERGWRALPFIGTASDVRQHLNQGRPVVALIEDRPGRYHYVVIVGWGSDQIVFHDPARGPFRVTNDRAFDRAWEVTNRTALLILPESEPGKANLEATPNAGSADAADTCAIAVDQAVQLARNGDLESAEGLLLLTDATCVSFSGAARELAGVRFLQRRWEDASALAERAVTRDPSDMHAWQLLATTRFIRGDHHGALRAWNSRNEPRVDLAQIEGLNRTHYEVVSNVLNLPSQSVLTTNQLDRATRRLAEVPALQMSRVTYSPRASGLATVNVAVVERPLVPLLPRAWPHAAAIGWHAATARELHLDVASPSGNGELWRGSWRWWQNRPRVALSVAVPQLWNSTGLWRLDAAWQKETYLKSDALVRTERRRAAVTFGDWASGTFRWEFSGALDQWDNFGRYLSAGGAVERRLFDDHLAMRIDGTLWPAIRSSAAFGLVGISSAWRSGDEGSAAWRAFAGLRMVSRKAPYDLWPAADTGHVRPALLRAHPLLDHRLSDGGAIATASLGRLLAHTTLEYQRDLTSYPVVRFRWAAFVDAAKQGRMFERGEQALNVDAGVGLRAQLPGASGDLRIDIARGLRDRNIAVSAGWQSAWPSW